MKDLREIIDGVIGGRFITDDSERDNLAGELEEALKAASTVEPFAFIGHPNLHVYLHPPCATVVDIDPAYTGIKNSINQQVQDGECDCENTSPWLRIYVEKRA